jgi:glycosyltransferase A (GT-A) superfamily protein (DUF2064 family)
MNTEKKHKAALVICIQEPREDGSSLDLGDRITARELSYLHQAFVCDTVINMLALKSCDIKLYYSPLAKTRKAVETILEYLKRKLQGKRRVALDRMLTEVAELAAGRWGVKIDESFKRCFNQGYERVIFLGSRTPTVTSAMVTTAFKVLQKKDVVCGPTIEGRYYMIGFSGTYSVPLDTFDWKSDTIYSEVASCIDEQNLAWEETEIWYAVEHPEAIEFLARDINQFRLTGDEVTARETEKVLERILNRIDT